MKRITTVDLWVVTSSSSKLLLATGSALQSISIFMYPPYVYKIENSIKWCRGLYSLLQSTGWKSLRIIIKCCYILALQHSRSTRHLCKKCLVQLYTVFNFSSTTLKERALNREVGSCHEYCALGSVHFHPGSLRLLLLGMGISALIKDTK